MIPVVFATARAVVPVDGGSSVLVVKGSHWPADDPIVLAQPSLFSTDPRWGLNYSVEPGGYNDPVGGVAEAASATPGEKRAGARRG